MYEAWDRERHRRVALKQLRYADPAALLRFKQEFRSLADISHKNLVRLEELLSEDDEWYFTMELVDGGDLLGYLRRELDSASSFRFPFDEHRLRDAFAQLSEGILTLHAGGMLHRDLKPPNVLVTSDGRVVILDFGLVAHLGPGDVSRSTQIMGTPAYMSPEQVVGEDVGWPSDWYSVGVMLYQALTGKLPFQGAYFQMMVARTQKEIPGPGSVVEGIPADLDLLCRELMRIDPAARPPGPSIPERFHPVAQRASPPRRRPARPVTPFVGRQAQLATLREALERVRHGEPATAHISGQSGMGKTSLARRFLAEVGEDPNALVLSGRCYQRESVPYKAVDSLVDGLRRHLGRLQPIEAARILPRDLGALARLFPVLKGLEDSTSGRKPAPEIPDVKELRRRGSAALRELLARLGDQRTVVLFIDDLQWGDRDSGLLLLDLMRPPDAPPLLLLASYRSDEAERSPLLRLLAENREPSIPHWDVEVGQLASNDARDLALARLGEDTPVTRELAAALATESGGNPFLVEQLSHHRTKLGERPGRAVRLEEVIEHRLDELPSDARGLLEVFAVAGRPLDLKLANQAAGLDPHESGAIELLRTERLVRSRAGDSLDLFETYHDRIRETVVSLLPGDRLPAYHNRLAAALQASGVADPETLAEHYLQAGDHELAARHALRAADQAAEALAFDRAAHLYQMGLELWPHEPAERRRLQTRLGDALVNASRGEEAARTYLAAAANAPPEDSLELTRQAGEQFLTSGLIEEGHQALRSVLAMVGMKLAPTPRRALLGLLARRAQLGLRGYRFEAKRTSEIRPDTLTRIDICWSAALGLAMSDLIHSAHFQAINLLLALKAGEPYRITRALIMELGMSATAGSRAPERTALLHARCRELVQQVNQPYTDGLFAVMESAVANLNGRFEESHRLSVQAEQLLRERCTGVIWATETALLWELHSLALLGRWGELAQRAPALLAQGLARRDNYLTTYIRTRNMFLLHLAADQLARAREEQDRSLEDWSGRGFQLQHYWQWYSQVEIDLYAGEPAAGWDRLAAQWRAYRRSLLPRTQGFQVEILFLRARTAIAVAVASNAAKRDRFLSAAAKDVRHLEGERTAWASAKALLAHSGIASVRGDRETALLLLVEAEGALGAMSLEHYFAATRWRRGELLGGEEGARLIEDAGRRLADQGVKNPAQMVTMLAPGRWA